MSSTRYRSPGSEPAPEHGLSSSRVSGINIGLNVIGRIARARTIEQRRAMVWIHNYARMTQLTADALSEDLGLTRVEIREALTDPECEHVERFTTAVLKLREQFESKLPKLVKNRVYRAVSQGMEEAHEDKVFGLIIGPERVGKSEAFLDNFLRKYMDRGILFNCPEGRDMRSFIVAFAQAIGIAPNSNKKNEQFREQILSTLATGVIEIICIDEIQKIWPSDLVNQYPEKIEFLRGAWDVAEMSRRARRARDGGGGLAMTGCATPQFAADLNTAMTDNRRWKPGQFEGRMRRTHTPDTLTEIEVRNIAQFMAPEFGEASINQLTSVAIASPGLLGFLGNVVGKIRYKARHENRAVTPELVMESARDMLAGTITEQKARKRAAEVQKAALK